jgi:hypothetical protein
MSIVPNLGPRARPVNTVFRMSPLATWFKVLARQPGLEHYAISNPAKSLAGAGSLQRFPKVEIQGRWLIPLLAHSHVWPLGRGGQFASFTSMAYWFDAATGALLGSCRYSDNRSMLAMHEGMGPWDWVTNDRIELGLPKDPVTVDFALSEVAYISAWTECGGAMGVSSGGIGQGNAYIMGPEYSLGDQTLRRRVVIETGGRPGQVCYSWTTLRQPQNGPAVEDRVSFWVNTGQHSIEGMECSLDLVSVDEKTRQHSWVQAPSSWRRLS